MAASVILLSPAALAQRPPPPPGPPGVDVRVYDEWRGDEWRRGDWRRDHGFFQRAQETCSHMATDAAYRHGDYSVQYTVIPKLFDGRRGPELLGIVRVHDRDGFHTTNSRCELRRGGEAAFFEYTR